MMKYGVFTQIAVAIIAVVIVFTYVRPTFLEIGQMQDKVAEFDVAIEQVNSVNNQLARLVGEVNSVSAAEREALLTFMPDAVDEVAVLRDIETMAEGTEAELTGLSYVGFELPEAPPEDGTLLAEPVIHSFQVSVTGPYSEVKSFIRSLEENDYPLHVYQFDIKAAESETQRLDGVEAVLVLNTYSRVVPEVYAGTSGR